MFAAENDAVFPFQKTMKVSPIVAQQRYERFWGKAFIKGSQYSTSHLTFIFIHLLHNHVDPPSRKKNFPREPAAEGTPSPTSSKAPSIILNETSSVDELGKRFILVASL